LEIQRVLMHQIDVLETMTPLDFLDFRDHLVPASGFQSVQFRLVENRLGMDPTRRLDIEGTPYKARFTEADRKRLRASEATPSLFDHVERWLERTPFLEFGDFDFWAAYREAVDTMLDNERRFVEDNPTLPPEKKARELRSVAQTAEQFEALFDRERYATLRDEGEFRLSHRAFQAALLINLYRDEPILQLPFRMLAALMDVDENLTKWRYRHALMVLRMIGTKVGTGGSSGHEYLRRTAERHKIFGDLFKISTFLIQRSALPELPRHVRRAMGFRFG
jgi:tryptophan 2,3-dioxygenase